MGKDAAYTIEYYFLEEGDGYFVILENAEYQLLRDALDRFNEENIQQTPTYGWGTFSLDAESCVKKEQTAFFNRKEAILLFQRLDRVAEAFKPESKENVHGAFELLMHRL